MPPYMFLDKESLPQATAKAHNIIPITRFDILLIVPLLSYTIVSKLF